jgi:hypothetical protein
LIWQMNDTIKDMPHNTAVLEASWSLPLPALVSSV